MSIKLFFAKMFKTVVLIAVTITSICYSGFIFSSLWNWFITPLGVMKINISMAIGILCVISYPFLELSAKLNKINEITIDTINKYMNNILTQCVNITLLLILGYVVHTFFM